MRLTLNMTTAQVVETSVSVNNNSPIQDYVHPDNQTQPTFEIKLFLHFVQFNLTLHRSTLGYRRLMCYVCHHWFSREMMSEERLQTFNTDEVSLPRAR